MERHRINAKQFTPRGIHSAISDAKRPVITRGSSRSLRWIRLRAPSHGLHDMAPSSSAPTPRTSTTCCCSGADARRDPPELEKYRRKFQYILVDEYQDTNARKYQNW